MHVMANDFIIMFIVHGVEKGKYNTFITRRLYDILHALST